MTLDPVWISLQLSLSIHSRQIAEHGGPDGVRDQSLLESSLARPQQKWFDKSPEPTIGEMAAALAFGIAKNHPFVDGNKRTSAVLMELFVNLNGYQLNANDEDLLFMILELASGNISEEQLAAWITARIVQDDQTIHESTASYAD